MNPVLVLVPSGIYNISLGNKKTSEASEVFFTFWTLLVGFWSRCIGAVQSR